MEGNICHTVKLVFASSARVCVCVDCGGAKWCKVFMPWFWLALVGEVDAGVRVVWRGCLVARCCTPSLINMQHGGRFALDLIALIGWTHLQHTLSGFVTVSAVQQLLQMHCCCYVSEYWTLHCSVKLCMSHSAPTHSYAYSVNTRACTHTLTHTYTNRQFGVGRSLKVILCYEQNS